MTIVVGYVPSPEGEAAVRAAAEEARRRNEDVVVMNASTGDRYVETRYATPEQLAQVRDQLAGEGITVDIRQASHARDAAEEILTTAEEVNASVIVVGVRHRSPVGKVLMGSTSQRVILDAKCPVLSVKS